MINCGDIYLNNKIYTMFFDNVQKRRVFYEKIGIKFLIPGGIAIAVLVSSLIANGLKPEEKNDIISDDGTQIEVIEPKEEVPVSSLEEIKISFEKEAEEIVDEEEIFEEAEATIVDDLMSAIADNPNLTPAEVEYFSDFRRFFEDYAHLLNDPALTAEILRTVTLEYTGDRTGGTLGNYSARQNHISIYGGANNFEDIMRRPEDRFTLFHEFAHVIQFSNYDKSGTPATITRGASEGITSIVTWEYYESGHLIKTDYIRTHAILQVLFEIVGDPDILIYKWLNDCDDETIRVLSSITGTPGEAKYLLEQIGLLEDSQRVMTLTKSEYSDYNFDSLREVVTRHTSFDSEFITDLENYYTNKYGRNPGLTDEKIRKIYDDFKLFDLAELTSIRSHRDISRSLREYYQAVYPEQDHFYQAYFSIIDSSGRFDRVNDTLILVNKPLLNKEKIGNEPTFVFHTPTSVDGTRRSESHFYETDAVDIIS